MGQPLVDSITEEQSNKQDVEKVDTVVNKSNSTSDAVKEASENNLNSDSSSDKSSSPSSSETESNYIQSSSLPSSETEQDIENIDTVVNKSNITSVADKAGNTNEDDICAGNENKLDPKNIVWINL